MRLKSEHFTEELQRISEILEIDDLSDFFDTYNFFKRSVNKDDLEISDIRFRDCKENWRRQYYVDIFCFDADGRGDSLRLLPEKNSLFGVYIASNSYGYKDDINYYKELKDQRITRNFNK